MGTKIFKRNQIDQAGHAIQPTIDFGVADAKGRKIGGYVVHYEGFRKIVEWELWEGSPEVEVLREGHVYGFRPQATRNGEPYGASQNTRWFTSKAERDAAVAKYFNSARNAARKKTA